MCSYTSYDGEPVTMNRRINTDLLREEMQFKGLYMSDWTTLGHAVTEGVPAMAVNLPGAHGERT